MAPPAGQFVTIQNSHVFRNLLLKSKMFHCFSIVYLGLSVTCCALLCAVVSCDACVPEAA